MPWQSAWAQSAARLPTHGTCSCGWECPSPSHLYLFHLLAAVRAEVRADWPNPGVPGPTAGNAFRARRVRPVHCASLLQAATRLPYRQLKGIQAGKCRGQRGNLPPRLVQHHFCTAAHTQLKHQEMSLTIKCPAQTDTYLRGSLYNEGNCNLTNYSAKSGMKIYQKRLYKAPGLPVIIFTNQSQ